MDPRRERLLGVLEELTEDDLSKFVFHLGSAIPRGRLDRVSRVQLAQLLLQYYPETACGVAAEALEKVPRMDLLRGLRREGEGLRRIHGGAEAETRRREQPSPAAVAAAAPVQSRQVRDSDLMKLANKMGKSWRQIGIEYLGIESVILEQYEENQRNNIVMQAFYMLRNWRNREKEGATAARLYHILDQEGVQLDHDAYAFLLEPV